MVSMTVSACVKRFLKWTKAKRAPKTWEHYRYQLGRLVKIAGHLLLGELTQARVTAWFSQSHPIQAVQRLCRWCAIEERSIAENPLKGMPKARMGERRRVLSRAESVRLIRAADRAFRPLLIAFRETMARPQEVRALTWDDVAQVDDGKSNDHFHAAGGSHFSLPTAKGFQWRKVDTGDRVIPISPRLSRLLLRLARRRLPFGRPIFRNRRGRAWTKNAVRSQMWRLRARLGMAPDRRGESVVAYTWRHTGATNAAAAGVRDFALAAVLGHASPRTTERYVHLRAGDVVDAMKRVWRRKRGD